MLSGWDLMTLREAGVSLIDCVHKTPTAVDVGYPYIAIPQMVRGRLDLAAARKISGTDLGEWTKKAKPQADDVVLSRRCNPGETAYVAAGENFALGQNLVILRADGKRIFPPFLRWLTRGPEWWEQIGTHLNVGAVFDSLKCADVPKFTLTVPPMDEQEAIAGVLGALDDKIEQNRRTAQALEGLARATFKAWFVDFEPVKAKARGTVFQPMSYSGQRQDAAATSFPGMPPAAFAALPDRLTDSPRGPVPEGWAVRTLADAFDINPPRRLSKGQDAPYLDMKNMPTDGHAPDAWESRPHGSGMHFINGDTLVARITPCLENGKTAYIDFLKDGEVAWGSTEYIVLRPKPPLPEIYAYCLARTPEFREFAIQNMTGTSGRQRVAASALKHYDIAVPDAVTAEAFGEVARPLFECIRAGKAECAKLAALRDYLLPRLLSGRVRVS